MSKQPLFVRSAATSKLKDRVSVPLPDAAKIAMAQAWQEKQMDDIGNLFGDTESDFSSLSDWEIGSDGADNASNGRQTASSGVVHAGSKRETASRRSVAAAEDNGKKRSARHASPHEQLSSSNVKRIKIVASVELAGSLSSMGNTQGGTGHTAARLKTSSDAQGYVELLMA